MNLTDEAGTTRSWYDGDYEYRGKGIAFYVKRYFEYVKDKKEFECVADVIENLLPLFDSDGRPLGPPRLPSKMMPEDVRSHIEDQVIYFRDYLERLDDDGRWHVEWLLSQLNRDG